ncbi:uncharacterized protein [Desmodus rotundus]|uniref:uncharacterized protein isoform X2 n=1 Tax=Desmodus rotundus TaxID=9430 RepID=UPI0023811275|nr:uncharacterized protein LOC112297214 isoform X2 [Desmodus rotundus]
MRRPAHGRLHRVPGALASPSEDAGAGDATGCGGPSWGRPGAGRARPRGRCLGPGHPVSRDRGGPDRLSSVVWREIVCGGSLRRQLEGGTAASPDGFLFLSRILSRLRRGAKGPVPAGQPEHPREGVGPAEEGSGAGLRERRVWQHRAAGRARRRGRRGAYAILFCVGKYRKAVAALGTRRPARTTTLSQSTAPLSPARKSAGCWNGRRTASVRQTDCAETRRTPAVRKRLRASPAAGSETASGLGKPDSGPRPRAAAPLRARLSAVRVVSAPARPPQAAATSGKSAPDSKSPPPAMTGPVGAHLPNAAGIRPRPGWTWKTRMLRNVHLGSLWLLRLRTAWALLLLAAADGGAARLPKAVVRLEPPWFNVLREDNVTLHCQGPHGPGDGPTQWSRDGTPIPTQVWPHFSFKAQVNDSGNYRCQTGQTSPSDPVRLNVTSDWLLLQTPRLLLQEGDPLVLRCHRWKNWPLFKITFFQDGTSKRYSPANSTFFIPHANVNHSGKYHCSGFIGKKRHMSQPVQRFYPSHRSFYCGPKLRSAW